MIYLAGGCFWGLEKIFSGTLGVTHTECGYAAGAADDPVTGVPGEPAYREAVRVEYDPRIIGLEHLLRVFFRTVVHPVQERPPAPIWRSSGIYWIDEDSAAEVLLLAEIERLRRGLLMTETGPLLSFIPYGPEPPVRPGAGFGSCRILVDMVRDIRFH